MVIGLVWVVKGKKILSLLFFHTYNQAQRYKYN